LVLTPQVVVVEAALILALEGWYPQKWILWRQALAMAAQQARVRAAQQARVRAAQQARVRAA
jgi:hypothetical protein